MFEYNTMKRYKITIHLRTIIISIVVLVISFIPDYIVPLPHKTFLASTVTAFLHVVVAVCTVPILVMGYQKSL